MSDTGADWKIPSCDIALTPNQAILPRLTGIEPAPMGFPPDLSSGVTPYHWGVPERSCLAIVARCFPAPSRAVAGRFIIRPTFFRAGAPSILHPLHRI